MVLEYRLLVVLLLSIISTYSVLWLSHWWAFGIDYVKGTKKHGTHKRSVSRLGGVGIFVGFVAGYYMFGLDFLTPTLLFCVSAPFFMGICEDLLQILSPQFRFLMLACVSFLTIYLVEDSLIYDIGVTLPPYVAVPLTLLAFTGLTNAINIIDGFNGLASGLAVMAFAAIAFISYIHFRPGVMSTSLTMMFATTGFMLYNFPGGRIFLGDGGAYFLGYTIALLSILLVNRSVGVVSPWFPVVLMAYPITDTLFAIYRRKFLKGRAAFAPDLMHLHSLIYRRVARKNHLTTLYILLFNIPFTILAILLHHNTAGLMVLCAVFCASYICIYLAIVHFRVKQTIASVVTPHLPESGHVFR